MTFSIDLARSKMIDLFQARGSAVGKTTKLFPTLAVTALAVTALAFFASQAQAQDQTRPDGWQVRFDRPGASEDQLELFVDMPPGWHVTSGPAAIYWPPDMEASGDYKIEMEVFLFDPGERRREAFGIFFGGRDLRGEGVEYSYFLIRNGREFIVKRREGAEAPTVIPWTGNDAILAYSDREEGGTSAKNQLVVEVVGDMVTFFANEVELASLPRAEVGTTGVYGFRVNHGLNLHISRLEMEPLGMGDEMRVPEELN